MLQVPANAKEVSLEIVAIRCGCGDPDSHRLAVCPSPLPFDRDRDRRFLYWHRSWVKRVLYALKNRR